MKWTSLNDLREKYLAFFESKGHLRLGSFSDIDNSIALVYESADLDGAIFAQGEAVAARLKAAGQKSVVLSLKNLGLNR